MRGTWALFFLCALFGRFSNSVLAQELSSDFADSLYKAGFYQESRLEYLRILYNTDAENIKDARIHDRIAQTYLADGDYAGGIRWCEQAKLKYSHLDFSELTFTQAIMQLKSGQYEAGYQTLAISANEDGEMLSRRLFLQGCARAHQWRLAEANNYWKSISPNSALYPMANEYVQATEEARRTRFLNPPLGAALGVVPGAGYVYAGHVKTGFSALIVIGLTSWATYAAFDNDVEGLGYLSGFVTVSWYLGSIYGSYRACERANEFRQKNYLQKIKF